MTEVEEGFEATAPDFGADASPEPEVTETTEAEAEVEEVPEVEESEADSPPAVEENDEEKTDSFQERITTLNTRWRETERALTGLEQENADLRQRLTEVPEPVSEVKTLADFDYDEKAYQEHVFSESRRVARQEVDAALSSKDAADRTDSINDRFAEAESAFAKDHADYFDKTRDQGLPISPHMANMAKQSEIGTDLLYHLALNPDEARRISKLPEGAAWGALTVIESSLKTEIAKSSKSVSNAPPPPNLKVGGAGATTRKVSTTDPKSDKMSDAEWFAAEEKRNAKRRG